MFFIGEKSFFGIEEQEPALYEGCPRRKLRDNEKWITNILALVGAVIVTLLLIWLIDYGMTRGV